jgi:hypothetical protein
MELLYGTGMAFPFLKNAAKISSFMMTADFLKRLPLF